MKHTIPEDTTKFAPMILDSNLSRWREEREGEYPLYQYDWFETLVIPASVEIPHDDNYSPFASYKQRGFVCNNLTECKKVHIGKIENHSPHLAVVDGVLYSADKSRLIYCFEQKTSFVIPHSVTIIEPYAFCLQEKLNSVVLHEDITTIGDAAFMACSALEEVIIPKRMKYIPCDCFDGCTSLGKVVLPEGLEEIRRSAFRQCRALKEIRLPDTLISVRGFEGCSSLQEIEIPPGVERVSDFLFCRSLRKVVLHKGVKRIEDYAFRYCDNLKEINLPEGLEYIGSRAFYPASLKRLVFPSSLQEIGCEAFYHNSKLYSIVFKSSGTKIDQAAFACCPFLFKSFIYKPEDMEIKDDVFVEDAGLDKYGFWD